MQGILAKGLGENLLIAVIPRPTHVGGFEIPKSFIRNIDGDASSRNIDAVSEIEEWSPKDILEAKHDTAHGQRITTPVINGFSAFRLGVVVGEMAKESKWCGQPKLGEVVLFAQDIATNWNGFSECAADLIGTGHRFMCDVSRERWIRIDSDAEMVIVPETGLLGIVEKKSGDQA